MPKSRFRCDHPIWTQTLNMVSASWYKKYVVLTFQEILKTALLPSYCSLCCSHSCSPRNQSDVALDNLCLCSSSFSNSFKHKNGNSFWKKWCEFWPLQAAKNTPKIFFTWLPVKPPSSATCCGEHQRIAVTCICYWNKLSVTFWLRSWYRTCIKKFRKHFWVLSSYLLWNSSLRVSALPCPGV